MNLKSYDVIIAFDPDWSQLTKNQKDLLKEWVEGDPRRRHCLRGRAAVYAAPHPAGR